MPVISSGISEHDICTMETIQHAKDTIVLSKSAKTRRTQFQKNTLQRFNSSLKAWTSAHLTATILYSGHSLFSSIFKPRS